MTAQIEQRYECAGYVYTRRTRMGFSPKFTITRKVEDHASTDMVIWSANQHPEPTRADIGEIVAKLAARFPDRRIFADTAEGLVPVYRPDPSPEPANSIPASGPGSIAAENG